MPPFMVDRPLHTLHNPQEEEKEPAAEASEEGEVKDEAKSAHDAGAWLWAGYVLIPVQYGIFAAVDGVVLCPGDDLLPNQALTCACVPPAPPQKRLPRRLRWRRGARSGARRRQSCRRASACWATSSLWASSSSERGGEAAYVLRCDSRAHWHGLRARARMSAAQLALCWPALLCAPCLLVHLQLPRLSSANVPVRTLPLAPPRRKGVLTETVMHTCIKQLLEEVRRAWLAWCPSLHVLQSRESADPAARLQ